MNRNKGELLHVAHVEEYTKINILQCESVVKNPVPSVLRLDETFDSFKTEWNSIRNLLL